ncbi:hypothetical protein BKA61DRAFT_584276 [Leptodontidium sp. MPI-SDFR-AT-0119]|nr:hypothetical protein BKA61DRAFT_584276 [Leptodontidium sp. MPI-SDFR-AT-0119]
MPILRKTPSGHHRQVQQVLCPSTQGSTLAHDNPHCSKGTTIAFLIHICEVDRVKKRSTVYQYHLRFKMLFNRENGRHIYTNDAKEALSYIYGTLARDFDLDITVKEKPVLGVDDLLLLLNSSCINPRSSDNPCAERLDGRSSWVDCRLFRWHEESSAVCSLVGTEVSHRNDFDGRVIEPASFDVEGWHMLPAKLQ